MRHSLREIVNAILYVNRTPTAREHLPHDLQPPKTVYDYYAKWEADGTTEAIHDALRDKIRVHKGRKPEPTASVIDSQSVKSSVNVPESEQGVDMGKKIKGRKRHVPSMQWDCCWWLSSRRRPLRTPLAGSGSWTTWPPRAPA